MSVPTSSFYEDTNPSIPAIADLVNDAQASAADAATSAAAAAAAVAPLTAAIATKLTASSNLSDLTSVPAAVAALGLNNVNNTSDANKPVSTAQAAAIASPATIAVAGTASVGGPLGVTGATTFHSYFGGIGGNATPLDLLTSPPVNCDMSSPGGSIFQVEPILGPFWGKDFTRAMSVRSLTTNLGSNVGEYADLVNLTAATGYPTAWVPLTNYLIHETVLNNSGKHYICTAGGTSAASGGPTGTSVGITDGTVTWSYDPSFTQENGGKTGRGTFVYALANSGPVWGQAIDLQLSSGTNKINAFTLELDLNNYRMDYATGDGGSSAGLQIFAGGPFRNNQAIGIGVYGAPSPAGFQRAILVGAGTCSDATIQDYSTGINGYINYGAKSGAVINDQSSSMYTINNGGTHADATFRDQAATTAASISLSGIRTSAFGAYVDTTTSVVGINLLGTYSQYAISSPGFNVNPSGSVTASGLKLPLVPNGAVAVTLGSIGPTGSHTTVQEWIEIIGTGGVIRYIPAF